MDDLSLPDIDEPFQPANFGFPKRCFGRKNAVFRSCQSSWFAKWKWLHYDAEKDAVFCHTCVTACRKKKLLTKGNAKDSAFLTSGYCNWKDATVALPNHETSVLHRSAVEFTNAIPAAHGDIAVLLSSQNAKQQESNRRCLAKVFECVRFLARQGVALRGDGDEKDGNLSQLLRLRAGDDSVLAEWLSRKNDRYTSPECQNEILDIMAKSIMAELAEIVRRCRIFAIMADEVTDISNKEQLAVCFRSVDAEFVPHEYFVGLYEIDSIQAETITACLKDVMARMNLSVHLCRGQCYDGAANMCGARSGVATRIKQLEPRAHFTHCHAHALNLAVGDTIKRIKLLRHTMDTAFEISKLLRFSPKRDAMFLKIKNEVSPGTTGFRTLCPTRWTVRAKSLQSIIDNYLVFMQLWEDAADSCHDSEARARIGGVKASMLTFDFLYGLKLAERLLQHSDQLSQTLQSPLLTASDAHRIANLTCQTLERIRTDEAAHLFWQSVVELQSSLGVHEAELPRKRKAPSRLQVGSGAGSFPDTPESMYQATYYECIDNVVACIRDRFNQPGYAALQKLENLLLKSAKDESHNEELKQVLELYKDDFDATSLSTQLELFTTMMQQQEDKSIPAICRRFQEMSEPEVNNVSQVAVLVKLILVTPATNAVSERSASAMRRVKTYLRSTTSQKRLNSLLMLHCYKDRTDELNLPRCLQEFVDGRPRRSDVFGRFITR